VPEDLTRHRCITHAYVDRSEFALVRDAKTFRIPVRAVFESNDAGVTRAAALAGGGIAVLPTYFVSQDLARGDLVRVLSDYEPNPLVIYAAYLSRVHQPMLLRLLIDFLVTHFGGDVPPWDRGSPVRGERPIGRRSIGLPKTRP
jgi:DNA-binding transcriptional LysR family regulator